MTNDLLTDEELIELTGYRFLHMRGIKRSGISFVKRRDGRPRVTWTHVNTALSGQRQESPVMKKTKF
jgi:hypothetical protein